jgi:DNA repair exonuclease SbcCD ATPase subunit
MLCPFGVSLQRKQLPHPMVHLHSVNYKQQAVKTILTEVCTLALVFTRAKVLLRKLVQGVDHPACHHAMNAHTEAIAKKMVLAGAELARLKTETRELREQLQELHATCARLRQEVESVTEEYNRIKTVKSLASSPGDKTEVKFKVNELVREIDKCIALLNR